MTTTRSKEQQTEALGFSVKTEDHKDKSSSNSSTSDSVPVRSRDPSRTCTHCGRTGHDLTEFFLLHGFPEWYQEQQRQNGIYLQDRISRSTWRTLQWK